MNDELALEVPPTPIEASARRALDRPAVEA
jgi:hypothetical protein